MNMCEVCVCERERERVCCFTSIETVGLLGTGAQDSHLDFHTTPETELELENFILQGL